MKSSYLTNHNISLGLFFLLCTLLICCKTLATAGTLSGKVTNGNSGVPAWVYVYSATDQYSYIGYAHTDANGDYTITDLASGEYKVKFDADYNYIDEWHNDKNDFNSADTITITASGTVADINAVLAVGGSVSGRMTDSNGTGLSGSVSVYTSTDQYSRVGFVHADDNGNYSIGGLANGDYKIEFDPNGYTTEWYNGKGDFYSANTVTVTAPNTTTGIDAVFAVGGSISGRMTDANGTGLSGSVSVYTSTDQYPSVADTRTDDNGDYTIAGLASGDYKVNFQPDGDYLEQWYNNKENFNNADVVTVTVPETTPGIDAVLEASGGISGRMTDSGGTGVSGSVFLTEDHGGYYQIHSTRSDTEGNYAFTGLSSKDSYKVSFQPDGDYATEWYNDKTNEAEADTITVTAPNTTTGIDAVLADAGAISGRVTNDKGEAIEGVSVDVYDDNTKKINISFVQTNTNGEYTVSNLAGGNYKVFFQNSFDGYLSEWYDNQPDSDNAVLVSVTASNTTPNIDAVLAPSGSISGKIIDTSGQPVSELWVSASYSDTFGTRALVRTDSNGEYKLNGLDTGSYKVHFEAGGELDEWYNNKPDFDSADSIEVTAPNDISGIDAVLEAEQSTITITPILMLLLQK